MVRMITTHRLIIFCILTNILLGIGGSMFYVEQGWNQEYFTTSIIRGESIESDFEDTSGEGGVWSGAKTQDNSRTIPIVTGKH